MHRFSHIPVNRRMKLTFPLTIISYSKLSQKFSLKNDSVTSHEENTCFWADCPINIVGRGSFFVELWKWLAPAYQNPLMSTLYIKQNTNRKRASWKSKIRIINKTRKFNGNISSLFLRHRQTNWLTYSYQQIYIGWMTSSKKDSCLHIPLMTN